MFRLTGWFPFHVFGLLRLKHRGKRTYTIAVFVGVVLVVGAVFQLTAQYITGVLSGRVGR